MSNENPKNAIYALNTTRGETMQRMSFQEYLDSKGNMETKPKVKVVADEIDAPADRMHKPPKALGMSNGQQPYSDGKTVKTSKDKSFGDQGDKDLMYDPTKGATPAKIPTAEFVHYELIPLVREAIRENPAVLESLVRDLKRNGLIGPLVGELMTHNETFKHMAEVMGSETYGEETCDRFARAFQETVSPPVSGNVKKIVPDDGMDDDSDEDDTDEPEGDIQPSKEDGHRLVFMHKAVENLQKAMGKNLKD
jgi:hypothetical protein